MNVLQSGFIFPVYALRDPGTLLSGFGQLFFLV